MDKDQQFTPHVLELGLVKGLLSNFLPLKMDKKLDSDCHVDSQSCSTDQFATTRKYSETNSDHCKTQTLL